MNGFKWFVFAFSGLLLLTGLFMTGDTHSNPLKKDKNSTINYQILAASIDSAIETEKESLAGMSRELDLAKAQDEAVTSDLYSIKVRYSIYSNLLIIPETEVKSLEQAYAGSMSLKKNINTQTEDLKDKRDRVKSLLNQTDGQYDLNKRQLKEIMEDATTSADSVMLMDKLKTLIDTLARKKKVIKDLDRVYEDYYSSYSDLEVQFDKLFDKFEYEIQARKRQELFHRKKNTLVTKKPRQIRADLISLATCVNSLFTSERWSNELGLAQPPDHQALTIIVLFFCITSYVLYRTRKSLVSLMDHPFSAESRWAGMCLQLAKKSIFLIGFVIFIEMCDHFFHVDLKIPIVPVIKNCLVTVLISCWFIDVFRSSASWDKPAIPMDILGNLRMFAKLMCYVVLYYIVVRWITRDDNAILGISRIGIAFFMYAWLFQLRKKIEKKSAESERNVKLFRYVSNLMVMGYFIIFVVLSIDLGGYNRFSIFLFVGIWKNLGIFLWSALVFMVILDLKKRHSSKVTNTPGALETPAVNGHWLLFQLYVFIWSAVSLIGVFYVWGGRQAVVNGIYKGYITPFKVGSMTTSLMHVTFAVILILVTRTGARMFKDIFQKKFLRESGMDIGVQESITTISVYLIWACGILLSMNVLGLNMTSITVVIGALGIGLGFGLQNIFNNFLSGIILLFERPIQVGDYVEINGIWANVKKINVRSTVVQTNDNATLIIPNSDFISSKVTNWSFKDRRLRRNINVGVAYGSNLELVKASLLEAADHMPNVLKEPKPDVVFKDFGDNALMFILRFWTHVDVFGAVETAVRFEIDRLFRERGIEISYPQMDLHVKTVIPPLSGNDVYPENQKNKPGE